MDFSPADLLFNPVKLLGLVLVVIGVFLCAFMLLFAAVVWGTINQLPFGQEAAVRWVFGELDAAPCHSIEVPAAGAITASFHDPGYLFDFGREHQGIDIAVPEGTPVVATHDGMVRFAGWNDQGYGNLVVVEDGDYTYYYGHLSEFNVESGGQVVRGQQLGKAGSTGNSTGPHVHYEVRYRGDPVDLMPDRGEPDEQAYVGGEDSCRPIVPPPPFHWPGRQLTIIGDGLYGVTRAELWSQEAAPGWHGRVLGFVRDRSGSPLGGVAIEVYWDGGSMRTVTAGNGWYEFILGPGQYNVRVVDDTSQAVAFDTLNCEMPGHCVNQVDFSKGRSAPARP